MKPKIAPIFLVLAIVQTVAYSILDYFSFEHYMKIMEVLTIPFIAFYYIFKTEFVNLLYVIVLITLFSADVINTFFIGYEDLSIFLYGLALFYYSYRVLKGLVDFKMKAVLYVAIPFMFIYIGFFFWFSEYMPISEAIIVYNFFMGVFIVLGIKSYVVKQTKENFILMISSLIIAVITVLYAYSTFVIEVDWIESIALNNLFTSFHLLLAIYILRIEKIEVKISYLSQLSD
ncbi:hypothetical protein SAMN05216480_11728 [Pustulibacterium marinum]|uniref:YhhN-like protein n=1 Tax=Pustulibacterium marinum TaxID=1224947 RepID=A0A1I7IKA6_9FLAO|nr:hypothetical protein [Pustulibacterium marinum]SFU73343.1 hypothetical protein SAMN05216480_11728 [Pustulibacterium marinum]